jgi:hypothetical protein
MISAQTRSAFVASENRFPLCANAALRVRIMLKTIEIRENEAIEEAQAYTRVCRVVLFRRSPALPAADFTFRVWGRPS